MPQTEQRRRGRPRDPNVIARDEQVYQLIAHGTDSRSTIAAAIGCDRDAVHLSCKRLEQQGRVRKCLGANGAPVWSVADGTPCA